MRRFTIFVACLLLFVFAVTKMVEWTTDYWWFSSLGQRQTFLRLMMWRAGGFVAGASLFALVFGQNVRLALSYLHAHTTEFLLLGSGINRFGGPSFDVLRRSTTFFSCAAIFMAGLSVANRFELWIALFGAFKTGQLDAASGHDVGFFLFSLPALEWIWNFVGVALFLSLICCAGLYFWGELIEAGPQILKVSHRVASHLVFLSATLILWQGVRHGIHVVSAPITLGWSISDIYGPAEAGYEAPTRLFFLLSSIPLAFLIVRRSLDERRLNRGQVPVGVTACLWVGLSLILPALAAPFGRSQIADDDTEQTRAIARHLTSTRRVWELDNVYSRQIEAPEGGWISTPVSPAPGMAATDSSFAREALWPLEPLRRWANQQNSGTVSRIHLVSGKNGAQYRAVGQDSTSYESSDATVLDVASAGGVPRTVSRRLISGLLLTENPPDIARDPTQYVAPADQPIVLPARYRISDDSRMAVDRSQFIPSLFLSWRFFDRSLLRPGPSLTWRLDPLDRVKALFPFINFAESDARPEIVGNRLYWNVAGFSVSRNYPDSAALQTNSSWRGINYLRQSTSVILDGKTGECFAWQLSPTEPFSILWRNAFPEAFSKPIPPDLHDDIEIEPDPSFVEASTQMLTRYHRENADEADFKAHGNLWRVWNLQPSQNWLCAFAPANGLATGDSSPASITAFYQVSTENFATNPRLNWQELRLNKHLALPDLARVPIASLANLPSPMVFSFDLSLPKNGSGETRIRLIRSTASETPKDGWNLTIETASIGTAGAGTSTSESLSRAAKLWKDWKQAFKEGKWQIVQENEKQLEKIFSKF